MWTLLKHTKKSIGCIGKQRQLLKNLNDTEHFFDNIGQSKSPIYYEISLYKLLKKCSLLQS